MFLLALSGCFTGVENTPKITDKDVSKVIDELERRQPTLSLTPYVDSVASWRVGKRFYVTDDQARLILTPMAGAHLDTVALVGKQMTYTGRSTIVGLDNRDLIDLNFDVEGIPYVYHTGKPLDELGPSWSIPLLIDMEMVSSVALQLEGKDVYVKTPIWYDMQSESMIHGRKFIKVHIDHVQAGNKVLPLRVVFTASDNGEQAFVWMSPAGSAISNRDYDSMFSARDVHENYPDITQEHWSLIIKGDVTTGMTKEECRLSRGAPRQVTRLPSQTEITEYWYYDGGSYLQFVDGLLRSYRK